MSLPPGDTGPSTSGGTDVKMTYADVEKVGNGLVDGAAHAEAGRVDLQAARGGGGDFTSYPAAQAVFDQHQAVVEVFESTLGLIRDDVETFGTNVVQAARTYQQTEENVLVCLQGITTTVSPTSLDDGFDSARGQHSDQLQDVVLSESEVEDFNNRDAADAALAGGEAGATDVMTAPGPDDAR